MSAMAQRECRSRLDRPKKATGAWRLPRDGSGHNKKTGKISTDRRFRGLKMAESNLGCHALLRFGRGFAASALLFLSIVCLFVPAFADDGAGGALATDTVETALPATAAAEKLRGRVEKGREARPALVIPRILLYLPRMVVKAFVVWPLEKLAYFVGRLQGAAKLQFYVASFVRTGFRPSIGVGVVGGSLFGDRKGLSALASYGGRNFQFYELKYAWKLDPSWKLELAGRYRRRGDMQFHGIGQVPWNESRYFYQESRGEASLEKKFSKAVKLEFTSGWRRVGTGDSSDLGDDDRTLSEIFNSDALEGFGREQNFVRTALAATFRLRSEKIWKPGLEVVARGESWLAVGGEGGSAVVAGLEAAGWFPLFRDRVVAFRLLGRGAGQLGSDGLPFYLLPRAGRGGELRGYPSGRFRDRLFALASTEYRWPVWKGAEGVLFFDVGRVFSAFQRLTLSGWNWGTGGGLRIRTERKLLFSIQFAYSPEGTELLILSGSNLF